MRRRGAAPRPGGFARGLAAAAAAKTSRLDGAPLGGDVPSSASRPSPSATAAAESRSAIPGDGTCSSPGIDARLPGEPFEPKDARDSSDSRRPGMAPPPPPPTFATGMSEESRERGFCPAGFSQPKHLHFSWHATPPW